MLKLAIFLLIFCSMGLLCSQLIPFIIAKFHRLQTKKVSKAEKQLEEMFVLVPTQKLFLYYTLSPVILGVISFLVFNQLMAVLIGAGIGLVLPTFIIKRMEVLRKQKFQKQLVDALGILSSSLRGGLSFLQAIEVLVEEMASPIAQEFSLVLRENKMGLPLEESLTRLNKRMQIEELELMINSILVARETGGDLTKLFSRLSTTIRDNRKLKENIKTLTLQGRIQGVIMSFLPLAFIWWVLTFNRSHFDIMLQSDIGRMLLFIAAFLQIVGMLLIKKFSTIRI